MTTRLVTRFAPSPTGGLHLGHAWSALMAHDLARAAGGRFHLRLEDIDSARCRPEYARAIEEDLRWLGLDWDGPVLVQSTRLTHYETACARLRDMGVLYRCVCTRSDIARAASAPQGAMGRLYPGTCRERTIGQDVDHPWSWRLDVSKAMARVGSPVWHDARAGFVAATPEMLGDVVIARKDAGTSYHLAVTADDAAQAITDVVRGCDLFEATHIHRLLQALLGLETPRYHHHPLIVDAGGARLAKRKKAPTLRSLREDGVDPGHLIENMRARRFPIGFALDRS
jgi:glutamyl-Q tRNA(Asp) synthetase